MRYKFAGTIFLLLLSPFLNRIVSAQINCEGEKIFNEKKCLGDEVNQTEKELFLLVNKYRAENNLPPVVLSESLSIVANRHLLDIVLNIKKLTHGWSNCAYDIKDKNTWNCVFESPKRLKVNYAGNGFENLFRNINSNASPALALEAWKKSAMHNALILNLENWKNTKYDAFGVALNGQYASIWFGSTAGIRDGLRNSKSNGLGVTFEKAVAGLTEIVSIRKTSSSVESESWSGTSPDKSVMLEIVGTEAEVSQATISIKIKLERNSQIHPKNRGILSVFLNNLAADWKNRETWINAAIKNLQRNPKNLQTINQGNKTITLTIDAQNYLSITVKPYSKPVATEIR